MTTMLVSEHHSPEPKNDAREAALKAACLRIAPQFDIRDLVAVNPFIGYTDQHFLDAAVAVEGAFHEEVLPGRPGPHGPRTECVADVAERSRHADAACALRLSLTRFLAMYLDSHVPSDKAGFRQYPLFAAYRRFAGADRGPELAGLRGYRGLTQALPSDPLRAAAVLLSKLPLTSAELERYCTRLLARLPGYAGYLRALDFADGAGHVDRLLHLSAILLWHDHALSSLLGVSFGPTFHEGAAGYREDRQRRLDELSGRERALVAAVEGDLQPAGAAKPGPVRAQLVFCIDVRSEPYRRHLESNASLETYGFAGFFGLPLAKQNRAGLRPLCPPLLRPDIVVQEGSPVPRLAWGDLVAHALTSPVSSLVQVEAWGLTYLVKLLKDAFPGVGARPQLPHAPLDLSDIGLERRVSLAQSILKNTSLRRPLARLVGFVGHGSAVTNNPQAGALACGACAGHSGELNARYAAALLNDRSVRARLNQNAFPIAEDVHFIALEHDTMTEQISVLDAHALPQSHATDLARLRADLEQATNRRRSERLETTPEPGRLGPDALLRRGRDYAETQPEWGLATNAVFVIGDRSLTRGASLRGRAFLHSYDEARDEDGAVLAMILTAPTVVGSWINLQYYASTVAPRTFGAGRKTLHNPTGGIGVVEGGQGDLVVGLSRESLTSNGQSVHEPLRLQVLVQASAAKVTAVVERNESIRRLVAGGWLSLSVVEQTDVSVTIVPLAPELFDPLACNTAAAE